MEAKPGKRKGWSSAHLSVMETDFYDNYNKEKKKKKKKKKKNNIIIIIQQ